MGRKKIIIERITDERNRGVTFQKRKTGLMKKAMELSILCDCQIALLIINAKGKLFQYSTQNNIDEFVDKCLNQMKPHEYKTNDQLLTIVKEKEQRSKYLQSENKKKQELIEQKVSESGYTGSMKPIITKFVNHSVGNNGKISSTEDHHLQALPKPPGENSETISTASTSTQPSSTITYPHHCSSTSSSSTPTTPVVTYSTQILTSSPGEMNTNFPPSSYFVPIPSSPTNSTHSPPTHTQNYLPITQNHQQSYPTSLNVSVPYNMQIGAAVSPDYTLNRSPIVSIQKLGEYNLTRTEEGLSSRTLIMDRNTIHPRNPTERHTELLSRNSEDKRGAFHQPVTSSSSNMTTNQMYIYPQNVSLSEPVASMQVASDLRTVNHSPGCFTLVDRSPLIPSIQIERPPGNSPPSPISLVNGSPYVVMSPHPSPTATKTEVGSDKKRKFQTLTIDVPPEDESTESVSQGETVIIHHPKIPKLTSPHMLGPLTQMSPRSGTSPGLIRSSPKISFDPLSATPPSYPGSTRSFIPRLPLPNEELSQDELNLQLLNSPRLSLTEGEMEISPSSFRQLYNVHTPRSFDLCISPSSAVHSLFYSTSTRHLGGHINFDHPPTN